jgi:hypothetical protein
VLLRNLRDKEDLFFHTFLLDALGQQVK